MKSPIFLVAIVFGLFFIQCRKDSVSPVTVDFSCADAPLVCDLTDSNGNFALDVFKKINSEEETDKNIFISPFSISTALTMTVNGANGQTLDDMRNTLRINNLGMSEVNESYKTLLGTLPLLDAKTKLKLANSIWHQINYPVLESFLQTNSTYYDSEILPVDFRVPAPVIKEVNNWVEKKTDGLIKETLKELPSSTVMLLINAIYFKGEWRAEFDKKNTRQADFHTLAGPVKTDMMHIPEHGFPYFENNLFQAVDLPYGDSIFSMTVFLPKSGHEVNEIIAELNANTWQQWVGSFQTQAVELFLPKFNMEYDIKLKRTLSDLGMEIAFSDAADFSNMINGGGVLIDEVIHKSFVEVNEKGTEAAAVTVVIIRETSAGLVKTVNVNRPFLFVIRDNKTNSILFMGKVMNPKA